MRAAITWGLAPAAWQAFLERCPQAVIHHGPAWHQAVAPRHGFTLDTALVRFESGEEALLPLAVRPRHRGLTLQAVSGLGGGYGGLVTPRPLSAGSAREAYRLVRSRYADLRVTGNPHGPWSVLPEGEGAPAFAQVLDAGATLSAAGSERVEVVEGLGPRDVRRLPPDPALRALARLTGETLVLFLAFRGAAPTGYLLLAAGRPVSVVLAAGGAVARPTLLSEALGWCRARGVARLDLGRVVFEAPGVRPLAFERVSRQGWRATAIRRWLG